MFAIARHRELLDKLGLASLEQVKAYRGDLVKNHRGRRDIFRINVPEAAGHAHVLYLKRILKPYRKVKNSIWFENRGKVGEVSEN